MPKKRVTQRRRSGRISALEEKAKAKACNIKQCTRMTLKRGCNRRTLQDVTVVNSEGQNQKHDHDTSIKTDQRPNLSSMQRMPARHTLEFILDLLQRKDTDEIFAQPVDPQEVEGHYKIIKEPMDFGTMRAKLQEGMYSSLEQFERDVFLISSNALHFNSSTTIYYTKARAIHELAHRVLYALKSDPKNFEIEFSLTRRHPGRKPQGKGRGLHTEPAEPGDVKIGILPNGLSLKKSTQTPLTSSCTNPHVDQTDNDIPSGSRDGRNLNSFESERRQTYRPWTSFLSENVSLLSKVYDAPKTLKLNDHAGIGYEESLMQFVSDLGPTAQMLAMRKRGKCLIEAPINCCSCTATPLAESPGYLVPAPSAPMGPAYLNGSNTGHMPQNFVHEFPRNYNVITYANKRLDIQTDSAKGGNVHSNDCMNYYNGACKGKMACANGERDIYSTFEGEMVFTYALPGIQNNLRGERTYATEDKDTESVLPTLTEASMNGKRATCALSKGKMIGTSENVDLFYGSVRGDITYQNQNSQNGLCSYFPITGIEDLNSPAGTPDTCSKYKFMDMTVQSSQQVNQVQPAQLATESQSRLLEFMFRSSNCSESSCVPSQTTEVSSLSKATTSLHQLHGFDWQYVGREGQNVAALCNNYGADSAPAGQTLEWSRPTPWGPQAICDFPNVQMQLNAENPLDQDAYMQQGLHLTAAQGMPLLDVLSFYERATAQRNQAEASNQCFWDVRRQSLMDNQQPDLALQL